MSIENATECIKKMVNDESFAKEVTEVASEDGFFSLAKAQGFAFSKDEWECVQAAVEAQAKKYAEENNIQIPEELTDKQLEAVTGGGSGLGPGLIGVILPWLPILNKIPFFPDLTPLTTPPIIASHK